MTDKMQKTGAAETSTHSRTCGRISTQNLDRKAEFIEALEHLIDFDLRVQKVARWCDHQRPPTGTAKRPLAIAEVR